MDPGDNVGLSKYSVTLSAADLRGRSFLLGNRAGFVLYLPVAENEREAVMQGSKWYGASGFGHSFLESLVTWIEMDGQVVELNRANQVAFTMRLDEAIRDFEVAGHRVRQRFFVPNGIQAVVMALEGDVTFGVRPELDMRYYQAFNSDFSAYQYEFSDGNILVHNHVSSVGTSHDELRFCAAIGTLEKSTVQSVPVQDRLVPKTYLRDEAREKAIESVYTETGQKVPDEAPIWNQDHTQVYSPAWFRTHGPVTVVCAFGAVEAEARAGLDRVKGNLPELRARKREVIARELEDGAVQTGNGDIDASYAHVLTRFNDCLVARDVEVRMSGQEISHYSAIFAGNKYFMDAWKRDENISLRALLVTNDFETVRAILDSTWQAQDDRTGRLPHIIRTGEPLVYYSSDGTLWALQRLFEYTQQSGDPSLLAAKLPMVQHFFRASMAFVHRGLLLSGGIIDPLYLWETWEDTPFTPRAGYPVEIELLWLTVLAEFTSLVHDQALATQMRAAHAVGGRTFEQFYGEGYLYDSLDREWAPHRILTPNGYLAFSLQYPLPEPLSIAMIRLARAQLAGRRGVRSLAPRDWPSVLPKAFLDDPRSHTGKNMASFGIFNYHRGIEWEWLNSSFVTGELDFGDAQHAWADYTRGQVHEVLHEAGIGGLSELWAEHGQLGADFQAWSMAALIESMHLYAGITVDPGAKKISVSPWIPPDWSYIQVRRRVEDVRFDVRYEQSDACHHDLQVRPIRPPDDAYTVTMSIRVPAATHVRTVTCNGTALDPTDWKVVEGSDSGSVRLVRASLPLSDGIEVHISAG